MYPMGSASEVLKRCAAVVAEQNKHSLQQKNMLQKTETVPMLNNPPASTLMNSNKQPAPRKKVIALP